MGNQCVPLAFAMLSENQFIRLFSNETKFFSNNKFILFIKINIFWYVETNIQIVRFSFNYPVNISSSYCYSNELDKTKKKTCTSSADEKHVCIIVQL